VSNQKISENSLLAAGSIDGDADYIPVVDVSEASAGSRNKRSYLKSIADWVIQTAASFAQSGSGAIARTMQAKAREIVSATDFGATGDGSTDDTVAIQAAIDAVADGGTVWFPSPAVDYKFSTLTVNKSVTLQGAGWQVRANQAFGHADWANTTYNQGSILRSTATSGVAITCDTTGEVLPYNLRDIAIIGPGSGTSTGIALGSASQGAVMGSWHNVMIANFAKGLNLTGAIDNDFIALRLRGNTTGIEFNADVLQNSFFDLEVQFSTDALKFTGGGQLDFYSGLLQNNTTAINFVPAAGGLESINFYGPWFENNTTNIKYDVTTGSVTGTLFQATRLSGGTAIAYAGANTVAFAKFIGNQWPSIGVTIGSVCSSALWLGNNSGAITDNGVNSQIHAPTTTYTPTLTNFTATINAASFCRVGNVVQVQVLLTITVGAPSGTIGISLPVAAAGSTSIALIGTAMATDTGSAYYHGIPFLQNTTTLQIHAPSSGNEWNGTVPHAWAVGDLVQVSLTYFS
jgi:hypothetical protein